MTAGAVAASVAGSLVMAAALVFIVGVVWCVASGGARWTSPDGDDRIDRETREGYALD